MNNFQIRAFVRELISEAKKAKTEKKDDKKLNLELFKMYPENSDIRYGVWVNPTQKS